MTITTSRLTPVIGATVNGFSAASIADKETMDALYDAVIEHGVVFLDGEELAPPQLSALARALGTDGDPHYFYNPHEDSGDVVVLSFGGDSLAKPDSAEWHADMTFRAVPPFASVLQAIEVPPVGGDTLWASMFAVHDALSPGLRSELAELRAVHDMGTFRNHAYERGGDAEITTALGSVGSVTHPVIEQHPVTGRPYVNVNETFTQFILGYNAAESRRILEFLFAMVRTPEFQVRCRWQPNRIAIWDNRGTQHYACNDYLPQRRVMHRAVAYTDLRAEAGTASIESYA